MCSTIAEPKQTFQIRFFHLVTWSAYFQTITLLYTVVEKLIAVSVCVYMTSVVQVCIHNTLILCSCLFVLFKARLSPGFFLLSCQFTEVFPLALCVGPQVPKFSFILCLDGNYILVPGYLSGCHYLFHLPPSFMH